MNLLDLFVKISVQDEASENVETLSGKFKNGLATAAKVGAAAVGAAATGIAVLTKNALNNYAEYEQLVGGVDTLFKDSSAKVQEYAANAYKTAGLSANEYMDTVTSFSASLLQSLGGDTEAAADMANVAITDMSDNANKMGTDMASIQNAYQGFAKQNYTMLDNLKLGYGGTKEEMQRLIDDANALNASQGKYTNYSIESYADIVSAIHDVQVEMGIYGTTADEASTTIQGSVSSMKAAWGNLLVGIADDNANFKTLTEQFVDSLVTVGENIIPRINIIIQGLTQLITEASQTIIPLAVQILLENLPSIVAAGMDLIIALVSGILDNIDMLIDCVLEMVDVIVDKLIDNLPKLIDGGIRLIAALANGLIRAIPNLVSKIPQIISSIVKGLISGIPAIFDVGKNIVEGLWNGIKSMGSWVSGKVKDFFGGIVGGVKDFLGIHSPSKVFAGIGGFMAEGLGEGFDDQFKSVKKDIENSIDFDAGTITADANISRHYTSGSYGAASTSGGGDSGKIVMLLEQYLPMLANMKVIMDSGQVVGLLAPGMDEELAKINARRARTV
ncbi:phage tail protein [Ruthenibacterium lactatiformans]|jgi:phage-related protein|uniref:phage tail protein n=1 Tax=Ruthenibacterium lactatiformans TaxID=1550024 RepID=UPI003AB3D461